MTRTAPVAATAAESPAGRETITGVCEVTLQCARPDEVERFYTGVIGLAILSREPDRVWLACGPRARLGLWTPGAKEHGDEGGRHVHFALSAAPGELDGVGERARRHGAEVYGPVEHDGGDRSLYVRDPAGNLVELWDFFARGQDTGDLQGARDTGEVSAFDTVTEAMGLEIAERVRVDAVRGAGHWLAEENPAAVGESIVGFDRETRAAPRAA